MSTEKTAAELAVEIKSDFAKAHDAVKEIAEAALGKANANEPLTKSAIEKADEALLKMNGLSEKIAGLEQKASRGGNQVEAEKSIGEQFTSSDEYKSWLAGNPRTGKASLQVKAALSSSTADVAGAVGDGKVPYRLPGIVELAQRRLTVRDLLAPGNMDGETLQYGKETGFVNNAGMVAEAAAKPQSDFKLDLITTTAKVIAHSMKASRQVLSDISQLRSMIDQRLLYGLGSKEEQQLLNGDGTGQNLLGIVPQATAYVAPVAVPSPTSIDQLRLAMLQAALAEYPATGMVLNPIDWAFIELMKDTTGTYLIGNPQGTLQPTLWGLPVVATQAMTVDKFLVGAFRQGAQIFDRWEKTIETGYENDDFTKNMVTILAENRLAFAVYRPESFIYGDMGRVV
jgi:HK97 family phage major capsid protein